MKIQFWKKKPEWVENLENEREALSEALSEMDGLGSEHENALKRIQFINQILIEAGYGNKPHRGVSDDTKAILGVQMAQTVWTSYQESILGRFFRKGPFHVSIKPKN